MYVRFNPYLIFVMERKNAIQQLKHTALPCAVCKTEYPAYRITIMNRKPSEKDSHPLDRPHLFSSKSKQNNKRERLSRSPKYIPTRKLNTSPPPKQQHPTTLAKSKSLDPPLKIQKIQAEDNKVVSQQYICLNCLDSIKMKSVYPETYQDLGLRYIDKIPTPDYQYAQQCIKMAKSLQANVSNFEKNILARIQEFKFSVYKICKESEKYCQRYLQYVQYFQKMRIEEWHDYQQRQKHQQNKSSTRNDFFLDQNEQLLSISKKIKDLQTLKSEIDKINITIPDLSNICKEDPAVPSRDKLTICDVPLSSMLNVKGRNYFGSADGRIIYECIEGLVQHHAHDSLIRSLAFDGQFTLYSGSDDFYIGAWDLHEEKLRLVKKFGMLEQKSYHRDISLIRDGQVLVSTRGQFDNFCIRLWDLEDDYQNIGRLAGHSSFIRGMVVADSAKDMIITVSDDKTIKLWDTKGQKLLKSQTMLNKLQHVLVSQKEKLCLVADDENKVTIMDLYSLESVTGWISPRKIVCCATGGDYIIMGVISNIGMWDWSGNKVWSFDTETTTFIPTLCMKVGGKILVSDGTGIINEFNIGKLELQ